ncbi:Ragulator complex protein LAMTOR3 [Exaiptasia diaphana]|nr:Ragulator complex protein LAMTOR3 [Exaiptasia diaphana]
MFDQVFFFFLKVVHFKKKPLVVSIVASSSANTVADSRVPASALRSSFLAIFANATEQASKLGLSKNKKIICSFPNYQTQNLMTWCRGNDPYMLESS